MKKIIVLLAAIAQGMLCQAQYTYLTEKFEESAWAKAGANVTAATGTWTTNKNVQSTEQVYEGTYSLKLSNKAGLVSPELTEGVGAIIYYGNVQNRQVNVEISKDGSSWTNVESYKETSPWTKHVVSVFDADVRFVKISTTSNNQFYLDNVLFTKLDGTDANGTKYITNLLLPYFTNDFETSGTYPQSKDEAATEKAYNVAGQGEWIYKNAYKGTNEAYIPDGSAHDLRMLKNTSWVVTPILSQGVVQLSFDEGRTGRELVVYASKDAGATWYQVKLVETQKRNVIVLQDKSVNRIKIANEDGSDADVDNISVTAFPEGTPATVTTGDATAITASTANVTGTVVNAGDKEILEKGFCWNTAGEPTLLDNKVVVEGEGFSGMLSGLKANTKVYFRAYALSLAGVGYGETKSFLTLPPTVCQLTTNDVVRDDERSNETQICVRTGGVLTDMGGAELIEAGVCWSESENPTVDDSKQKAYPEGMGFSVFVYLQPEKTYHFRAYATNEAGTSYGEEKIFVAGEIVVPEYDHHVYWVDENGDDATADGSKEKPFYHLDKVVTLVNPGDTIYMNAGTYKYSQRINISRLGKKDSGYIALFAKGGRAKLDFTAMAYDADNQGMRISASYWHIYGLDIFGCGDNGVLIERNKPSGGVYKDVKDSVDQAHDNIIENCSFYRCGDTGLQIKNLGMNNRIINCDSYFNRDDSDGDADGFAVKLSHGDGNYFYGCRAWNNSDDGWDGFIRQEGGFPDDITTTLENCWAFTNGYLEDGTQSKGNGNGFKMGSDEGRNNMIFNRCLAFNNLQKNFDQNHNTGNMILNNCSSYSPVLTSNKSHYTYRIDEPLAANHEAVLHNCVSISDGITDRNKSAYAVYSLGDFVKLVSSDINTLPNDYKSIDFSDATAPRQADGTLPEIAFMHIKDGNTKLIDAGTEVIPYAGMSRFAEGVTYNGTAPDLGCFETGGSPTSIGKIESAVADGHKINVTQCQSGLVLVTIPSETTMQTTLYAYSADGKQLGRKVFYGNTTAVYLPVGQKMIVLRVNNAKFHDSIKILMK